MLNLARNLLTIVENLNGLDSLTELNLRHNQVSAIVRNKTLSLFFFSLFLTKYTITVTCLNCISISGHLKFHLLMNISEPNAEKIGVDLKSRIPS